MTHSTKTKYISPPPFAEDPFKGDLGKYHTHKTTHEVADVNGKGSPDWRQVPAKEDTTSRKSGEERKFPMACLQVRISDAEGQLRSMVLKILYLNVLTDQIGKQNLRLLEYKCRPLTPESGLP